MTNAPSKPYIWRFAFDDNFSEAAANSTNEGYSFEKRKVSTFVEYSEFEKLQAENVELQAKYNFMVDSAQQNARERDELHEELRQREMATPTMNAVQMLTMENQKLRAELERAKAIEFDKINDEYSKMVDKKNLVLRSENERLTQELEQARGEIAQFMQGPQWRNDEVQKIINEKAQLKAELDQAQAEINQLYADNHNLQVDHDVCFQEAERFKLMAKLIKHIEMLNVPLSFEAESRTFEQVMKDGYETSQVLAKDLAEARAALEQK